MKIGCKRCGTYDKHEPCETCGVPIHIGSDYRCPHEPAQAHVGFKAFYHPGIGKMITGLGDLNKEYRPKWENDHIVHLQQNDRPAGFDADLKMKREARREAAERQK